jgi:hypothetical protein
MAEMILAPSLPGHCWYSMSKKLKNNDNISDLTQYEKFALIIPNHHHHHHNFSGKFLFYDEKFVA